MEYGLHLKVDLMEPVGQTFLFFHSLQLIKPPQHNTLHQLNYCFSPFAHFFLTSSLALNTWLYSFCHILFFLPSSLFSSPPDVGAGPENSCCSSPFVSCKTSVDVKVMHNREDGKKPILHQIFRHFGWSNMRKRK